MGLYFCNLKGTRPIHIELGLFLTYTSLFFLKKELLSLCTSSPLHLCPVLIYTGLDSVDDLYLLHRLKEMSKATLPFQILFDWSPFAFSIGMGYLPIDSFFERKKPTFDPKFCIGLRFCGIISPTRRARSKGQEKFRSLELFGLLKFAS